MRASWLVLPAVLVGGCLLPGASLIDSLGSGGSGGTLGVGGAGSGNGGASGSTGQNAGGSAGSAVGGSSAGSAGEGAGGSTGQSTSGGAGGSDSGAGGAGGSTSGGAGGSEPGAGGASGGSSGGSAGGSAGGASGGSSGGSAGGASGGSAGSTSCPGFGGSSSTNPCGSALSTQFGPAGYYEVGPWKGYGAVFGANAQISPTDFFGLTGGALCVCGNTQADPNYGAVAGIIVTLNQPMCSMTQSTANVTGAGLKYQIQNPPAAWRIQLQGQDENDPSQRWCVDRSASQTSGVINWGEFKTECWGGGFSVPYNGQSLHSISIMVPGQATMAIAFNFCLIELRPE